MKFDRLFTFQYKLDNLYLSSIKIVLIITFMTLLTHADNIEQYYQEKTVIILQFHLKQ